MTTALSLLLLLIVANGSPVIARAILGRQMRWPLDGGLRLADRHRLFGRSKTVVGVLVSMIVTALLAPAVDIPWQIGLLVGALAMLGDTLTSLLKRRLGLAPGTPVPGLDQIPEALLPVLACKHLLALSWLEVLWLPLAFMIAHLVISRVFYSLGLHHRPY